MNTEAEVTTEEAAKLLEVIEKLLDPALSAWEVQVWRAAYLKTVMDPKRTIHDHAAVDALEGVVETRGCPSSAFGNTTKKLGWSYQEHRQRVWDAALRMQIKASSDQVTVGLDQVWENVFVQMLVRTYPNVTEASDAANATVRIVEKHRREPR